MGRVARSQLRERAPVVMLVAPTSAWRRASSSRFSSSVQVEMPSMAPMLRLLEVLAAAELLLASPSLEVRGLLDMTWEGCQAADKIAWLRGSEHSDWQLRARS
jgi:hypothetical protein